MTDTRTGLQGAVIIFDLDGTLIDTAGDLAASMNAALAAQGVEPAPPAAVRHLVGHGARRMIMRGFELSTGRAPTDSETDAGLAAFLDHYEANIAVRSRPFEGAVEAIHELHADGAVVAICTNKREALARRLIEALGLADLFVAIVGADTAAAPKPDPAPVLLCMALAQARTGAKTRTGVFIGDSDTDILAAKAASLPCLIADFGYGPLTQAHVAHGMFSHYRQAPSMVRQALAR